MPFMVEEAHPMQLRGIGIGRAVAAGPVRRMADPLPEPPATRRTASAATEQRRVRIALRQVSAELLSRAHQIGGEAGGVLESQALMAEDPTLLEQVDAAITGGRTAERAVFEGLAGYRDQLIALGGRFKERATDVADVANRAIARLTGVPLPGVPQSDEPFVLVARDLAPADTATLDLSQVLAILVQDGGPTSHTAIVARARGVPAIVDLGDIAALADGSVVVADAAAGTVEIEPAASVVADARARSGRDARGRHVAPSPGRLSDGTPIGLLANLGGIQDVGAALQAGAEGVGLLRTEFLFFRSAEAPTVTEQRRAYTEVFASFTGRRVVARVLDAGADKPLSFLGGRVEANPALGMRGLRAFTEHEDVLREQLTALAEAAEATGVDLWALAPMVTEPDEAQAFTRLAHELGVGTAGSMIEVPSSALLAHELLAVTDFASVGTNDLVQYTLAADRQLGALARMQDPWHPAVLRLIAASGRAGTAHGKSVGVCGEAASDPALAVVLVGLGVTSLSMAPSALAEVRDALAGVTLEQAQARATAALATASASAARAAAAG